MKSKQNTSLIIKAIMLLLALIVMVFAASLAWFAPTDKPVNADGLIIQASGSEYFEMAVGFESSVNGYQYTMSQYSKNMNLRDIITAEGTHYDVLHDFSPIDITGDGVTLVRPSMLPKNTDIDRNVGTFTSVSPNKEYICFDMYFKAEDPCRVFLDSGSFVKGAIEETPGDGNLIQTEDTGDNRKASEGNFSKDAVVGAVRVSFVNYSQFIEGEDHDNLSDSARLLWLPRPDIHLNSTNNASLNPWTLSQNVQPNEIIDTFTNDKSMNSQCDTYTHHYFSYVYDENIGESGGYTGIDINYIGTVTDPSRDAICDVTYESNGYYYGKTQVNIWIEGCDAEARRAIAGGQFQVNFDLAGA
ncbi:MAG: hypothetical protein IJO20_04325 [Ruminococcus sp.]|nr:hypothetical protein [Ruminococcus sp.]